MSVHHVRFDRADEPQSFHVGGGVEGAAEGRPDLARKGPLGAPTRLDGEFDVDPPSAEQIHRPLDDVRLAAVDTALLVVQHEHFHGVAFLSIETEPPDGALPRAVAALV